MQPLASVGTVVWMCKVMVNSERVKSEIQMFELASDSEATFRITLAGHFIAIGVLCSINLHICGIGVSL